MKWKHLRNLLLVLLSASIVVFISGVAYSNNGLETKDTVVIGTDVNIQKDQIYTNVVSVGGSVTILDDGQITGDAVAIGGDVILKPNSRVDGNAVAIGGEIIKAEGVTISGDEVEIFSSAKILIQNLGLWGSLYLGSLLFNLISLLVILAFGVFLLLLLPGHLQTISSTISQHPFKSGMWGLGGIIFMTLFVGLLAGSVLGFLAIPIVNLAFAVAGLLGCVATSLWIGQKMPWFRATAKIKPFLMGMLILALISLIPLVGGAIALMLNLFGFGAVLLSRVGTVQPETIQKRFDQLEGNIPTLGT
jgi:hypothetical protein